MDRRRFLSSVVLSYGESFCVSFKPEEFYVLPHFEQQKNK